MSDYLRFSLYRARGWLAWQCVRYFDLPLSRSPRSLIYRVSARLWGVAYAVDAFPTMAQWREHVK